MVQSITEREKGTPSDSDATGAVRAIADGPAAAPTKAAAAHAPTNSRLRMLFTQKLPTDVLQNVGRALDAHFSGQNRVFIFDAENAFETDVHIGLDDGLPEAGAVTVPDGAEGFGGGIEIIFLESKIQDAILVDVFGIEGGVLHMCVFRRPAVGDPVGLRVLGRSAGAAGKTDDDFYVEHFGKEDGLAKSVYVFLSVFGIGMNGVAVATEGGNVNPLVFKSFLPSLGFATVGDEFVERTMMIVRIPAGADLHGLEAEGADFLEHGVEGKVVIDRIEYPDGNLAVGT